MILNNYEFKGCFSGYIEQLLIEKNAEGFIYDSAKYILIRFDKFCLDRGITEAIITRKLVNDWGTSNGNESRITVGSRISVIRQLALYMASVGIGCYIPSNFSDHHHKLIYVLNETEVTDFFAAVDSYVSGINADRFNRLALEYKILFRVIFCCGLRVSEARKLKTEDVNLESGKTIIRQSKGRKDRIVFIPEDLISLCKKYLAILEERYGVQSELFFPAANTEIPLQAASINVKFKDFWNRTGHAKGHSTKPTVHSLRHSFVVIRMNKWMEQGIELNGIMPYLSRYLGHSSIEDTFYYYHQIESAFKIIRAKDKASSQIIPEVSGYEY